MKNTKNNIPVSKNKEYTLTIEALGNRAEGIAKIDGFTIFIEKAIPGDIAKVKVTKVKKNYAFGKLIEIIEPSINRQEPKCVVANRCGGCQVQHLNYRAQLDYKEEKVKDAIVRIGKIENPKINPIIGMENPYNYRNKAQFPVRMENGKLKIGFFKPRTHDIVDTNDCIIQHSENKEIIGKIREFLEDYKTSIYDENTHKGLVRHIVTRVGFHTNEIMVCIVINGHDLPNKNKLIEKLVSNSNIKSIVLNHNTSKGNVILGNKNTTIYGKDYIYDYIGDLKFKISPLSFFQVNPVQTEILYDKAVEYAGLSGNEIVWDAYCGIGTISLALAKKAKKVYGVEIVEDAIKDANINAKLNNIKNTQFIAGKAEDVITKKYKDEGIKTDVIVVDPPRKGCDEKLLGTIVNMRPEKIVYVSCDPATLARDLLYLTQKGYKVEEVQPVDMFPQTTHVETIALLQREIM